jgi:transcriptional regulator with XRE-family HTH domain
MTDNTNIINPALSDSALVKTLGEFIRHHRLEQNKTQSQLAIEAGINRSTLIDFEKGQRANIITFIQLLRALHLLYTLKEFQIRPQLSPLQLAEQDMARYKRASRNKKTKPKSTSDW